MRDVLLRSVAITMIAFAPAIAFGQAPGGGQHGAGGAEHGGGAPGGTAPGAPERGGTERGSSERGGAGAPNGKAAQPGSGPQHAGQGKPRKAEDNQTTAPPGRAGEAEPKGEAERKGAAAAGPGHAGAAPSGGEHGASARPVHVTTEQRTRIRSTLRSEHVQVLHGVNFALSVGTLVPGHYEYHLLPPAIIEFIPEYRGFDYILVDNEIIIIEPGTRRIVDVID